MECEMENGLSLLCGAGWPQPALWQSHHITL